MSGSGKRRHGQKTVVKNGGPSRLRNKRQEKIVGMIDGYDSVMTLSAAMAAVFMLWVIPALALMGVGLLGLMSESSDPNSAAAESFRSALSMVQGAQSLLGLVTSLLFIYWAFRARENVRRLGKRHRIGVVDILIRRVKALIIGFLALVVAFFVPIQSVVIVAVALVAGAAIYVSTTIYSITYATVRMLWRTSSPPIGLENEMPHVGLVWIWSWAIYGYASPTVQASPQQVTLSTAVLGILAIFQGVVLLVSVLSIAKVVMSVAIRQEDRLDVIVAYVDNDGVDENADKTVTTDQIQSAWEDSDRFVSFNH